MISLSVTITVSVVLGALAIMGGVQVFLLGPIGRGKAMRAAAVVVAVQDFIKELPPELTVELGLGREGVRVRVKKDTGPTLVYFGGNCDCVKACEKPADPMVDRPEVDGPEVGVFDPGEGDGEAA